MRSRSERAIVAATASLLATACSRSNATSADAGADGQPSAAPSPPSVIAPAPADAGPPPKTRIAPAEARRTRIAKIADDPSLTAIAPLLAKQYPRPAALDVQSVALSLGKRRALLVSEAGKPTSDAAPLVVVVDEDGRLAWSKEHPIGGVLPPVGPLAVGAGPDGRVALAICDPPTKTAALRLWDDDGSPFADFQALEIEGCEALGLLYWPRRGWIMVAAGVGVTRARLVHESGSLGWGRGLELGARSLPGAIAAPSLAADTDESFVLVQLVQPSAAPGSPFHALAFRYDLEGAAIWPAAIDLGELPRPPAGARAVLTRQTPAGVHVSVAGLLEADVRPSGDVTRGRAPP